MELKSISNNQLTLLRKLGRKKYRHQENRFLAEGERAVEQIIKNKNIAIDTLFFDEHQACWKHPTWAKLSEKFSSVRMDESNFLAVSDTDRPQGVMALCKTPKESSVEKLAQKKGILLATDAIRDPGNMGTIIRTASWFGVQGILAGKGTVDMFHPKVVRATAGATGAVPFAHVNLAEHLSVFEKAGWKILLLDAAAESVSLKDLTPTQQTILVVGNEAHGIDSSLSQASSQRVRIASAGDKTKVESLNAAIAASIGLYALS